jgi:hypothetical protein
MSPHANRNQNVSRVPSRSLVRRYRDQIAIILAACTLLNAPAFVLADWGVTVTPSKNPQLTPVGKPTDTVGVSFTANITGDPPTSDDETYVDGPYYTWSGTDNPDSSTATKPKGTPGDYIVGVGATATYDIYDANGNYEYSEEASGSGSTHLVVVAVTSIALADGVAQTLSVGDSVTKSDCVLTTSPSDHTDLVKVPSVTLAPGDNWVTATCGESSVSMDITAGQVSGGWDGYNVTADDENDQVTFHALCSGGDGSYSIQSSGGLLAGGDTGGALEKDTPFSGAAEILPPGGEISPGGSSCLPVRTEHDRHLAFGLGSVQAGHSGTGLNAIMGVDDWALVVGIVALVVGAKATYDTSFYDIDGTVAPAGQTQLASTPGANSGTWNPAKVTANASSTVSGKGRESNTFGWKYAMNPALSVTVAAPSSTSKDSAGNVMHFTTMALAKIGSASDTHSSDNDQGTSANAPPAVPLGKSGTGNGYGDAKLNGASIIINNGQITGWQSGEQIFIASWGN